MVHVSTGLYSAKGLQRGTHYKPFFQVYKKVEQAALSYKEEHRIKSAQLESTGEVCLYRCKGSIYSRVYSTENE